MTARYRVEKDDRDGMWVLHKDGAELARRQHHAQVIAEIDWEEWLDDRVLYPGKTFTQARNKYRKGRLGSHVETNGVRADRAQAAVDGRQALVAGALVHPVRTDGD